MTISKKFLLGLLITTNNAMAQTSTHPTSLTVAKDGSGNYQSIQEVINSVRDLSQTQVKIFIKNGVYNEKLIVPSWKTNIALIGENYREHDYYQRRLYG